MGNFAHLKRDFITQLIATGECSPNAAPGWLRATVPEAMLQRWVDKFYKAARPDGPPRQPRLVNHFCVGADPEFAFQSYSGATAHAETYKLIAGLCFGADNNGRLVELRPQPSRFVLEVVASMLQELRYLALRSPKITGQAWKAGAWTGHDGLGGHIHFGRKKHRTAMSELRALDNLTFLLTSSGIFPEQEINNRLSHTTYGRFGDTRYQTHGYEYRTLPSWLYSPWVAYLCLVLAKLVVYNPTLVENVVRQQPLSSAQARKRIRNILAQYKGLDDDARIASLGLDVWGLSVPDLKDFKAAWGIVPGPSPDKPVNILLPPHIEPTAESIEAIFQNIVSGRRITNMNPGVPNWPFAKPPKGFVALQDVILTTRCPGLGEATWDLVAPVEFSLEVQWIQRDNSEIWVDATLFDKIGVKRLAQLRQQFPNVSFGNTGTAAGHCVLRIDRNLLLPKTLAYTKQVLRSGLLGVFHHSDANKFVKEEWQPCKPKVVVVRSKILHQ